ncbi:DivIVA domain-containing protein [Nocardioides terrisoli]|uniref:DivIVA domain-containing protein n=1 Tax=Nocardioides terrisoli TaxID=3388267 RepID=UPI00287B9B71|nr:DivIVA domain-containing protein [Nocardioides marmorisolisilvae]
MAWFFGVVLVLLIGGVVVVAAGRGEGLAPAQSDDPRPALPDHTLGAADLRAVRFSTALRGYRVEEVDALLRRLAAEMEQRETR